MCSNGKFQCYLSNHFNQSTLCRLGKLVATYPFSVILATIIVSGLCCLGIFNIRWEHSIISMSYMLTKRIYFTEQKAEEISFGLPQTLISTGERYHYHWSQKSTIIYFFVSGLVEWKFQTKHKKELVCFSGRKYSNTGSSKIGKHNLLFKCWSNIFLLIYSFVDVQGS